MVEDIILVKRLRHGDQNALRAIYLKYKDDMLTVAACLLADSAEAEDCLHDVFVRFAANAGDFRLRRSLKNFLITCIANRARDWLRQKARQPAALEQIPDPAGIATDPERQGLESEESDRLIHALAELPPEQREVIVLHLQGELTFKLIASELGISINTVQSRYRYGIDKLRKLLTGAQP